MKASVDRKQFLAAVRAAAPLTKGNGPLSRRAIRLESLQGGDLQVRSTNLDVWFSVNLRTGNTVYGSCLASAQDLIRAKTLSGAVLTLTLENNRLTLADGVGSISMDAMDAEDFPVWPTIDTDANCISVASDDLKDCVAKTVFAAAQDRYAMNGIHIKTKADKLEFAATNGHRLAIATCPASFVTPLKDFTIPIAAAKLIKHLDGVVCIRGSSKGIKSSFTSENTEIDTEIVTLHIDAGFPQYDKAIPQDAEDLAKVDAKSMINALRAFKGYVDLDFGDAVLKLTDETSSSTIPAECASRLVMRFNAEYLAEGIKAAAADTLALRLRDPKSPLMLKNGTFTYVLMPCST